MGDILTDSELDEVEYWAKKHDDREKLKLINSHRALAAERDKLQRDLDKATEALRIVVSLPLEEIV